MRFRLLEAPALSAKSWKDKPQAAMSSASRAKKPEEPAKAPTKGKTYVPTTPEEWEEVLYDPDVDRAFREIACVKWLENNKPSSPLLSMLGEIRSKLRSLDAAIQDMQTSANSKDGSHKFRDPRDGELKQDKSAGATERAIAQREIDSVKKSTETIRKKLNPIFNAIFIAIDCKSDLFESVITKLDLKSLPQTYYGNLVSLANLVAEDKTFDTEQQYLRNMSLYSRLPQEFVYTVKVLMTVSDPDKLRAYYDPEKVTPKDLFSGTDIKPAGIAAKDPDDFDTIYGVLETWKSSAPNENTAQPTKKVKDKANNEFSSEEEANKAGANKDGQVITINGKFRYDGEKREWVPVTK